MFTTQLVTRSALSNMRTSMGLLLLWNISKILWVIALYQRTGSPNEEEHWD